jgi:hypothetical protein
MMQTYYYLNLGIGIGIGIGIIIGFQQYPNVTGLNILFVFSSFSTDAIVTGFLNCLNGPRFKCYFFKQLNFSSKGIFN